MSSPLNSSIYLDPKNNVSDAIATYADSFADSQDCDPAVNKSQVARRRLEAAETVTEAFYNLATDFYEYGWGQSFHFAPIYDGKQLNECIRDYERDAGKMVGAKSGLTLLDVGCGVGGPGREIARSTRANIVGLNYNAYQIEKAKKYTNKAHLDHLCTYIKADFCNMNNIEDNTYDGAFAFEAICHAKDLVTVYKEVLRVLKPGSLFVDMMWAMTDKYNPENPKHDKSKHNIMFGNSLPDIRTQKDILAAMREAGFEILEFRDLARDGDWPWYHPLENQATCSLKNFQTTTMGRIITQLLVGAMEILSLAPKGTYKVANMLEVGAKSLVEGGKLEIFTAMFRILARKPTSG